MTIILRLTLATALAGSLAACAKKDDKPAEQPPATADTAKPGEGGAATTATTPPATGDAAAAAGTAPAAGKQAQATLESKSGSQVTGTITLTAKDGKVEVVADVAGLAPGDHGFHIHEKGDCSAPDATSAGGHFNPGSAEHGAPEAAAHHAGDFGNLTAGADGKASKTWTVDFVTLDDGPTSALGKAFVVHEKPDDLKTQPTGNAGGRVACGVVVAK